MKTEITPEEYKNIYEVCNWDPKAISIVLKRLGYSDELIVKGDLWLGNTPIKSLVNVKEIRGWLDLRNTSIEDLGNLKTVGLTLDLRNTSIEDLGNLEYVGGSLGLMGTPIQDLGNLQYVGRRLFLENTPISKKHSKEEIKQMVEVKGAIFL